MMMLSHYLFSQPIQFDENIVNVLVVENGAFFRELVYALQNESDGSEHGFYLSSGLERLNLSKEAEVLTDFFTLDFASRPITTQLTREAAICCTGREKEL